jgi:hypothetical protein
MSEEFISEHEKLIKDFGEEFRKNARRLSLEVGIDYISDDSEEEEEEEEEAEARDSGDEDDIARMAIYSSIQTFYESEKYSDITDIMLFCIYQDQYSIFDYILDAIIELRLKMPATEIARWPLITSYLHENDDETNFQDFIKTHKHL